MRHSGFSDILEGRQCTEPKYSRPRPSIARRPTRATTYSQDVGGLGAESGTEETPPADIALTTQLYRSFDPLRLPTAVRTMHRTNQHGNSTLTVLRGAKHGQCSCPRLSLLHGQLYIKRIVLPSVLPQSATSHQLLQRICTTAVPATTRSITICNRGYHFIDHNNVISIAKQHRSLPHCCVKHVR